MSLTQFPGVSRSLGCCQGPGNFVWKNHLWQEQKPSLHRAPSGHTHGGPATGYLLGDTSKGMETLPSRGTQSLPPSNLGADQDEPSSREAVTPGKGGATEHRIGSPPLVGRARGQHSPSAYAATHKRTAEARGSKDGEAGSGRSA